MILDTSQFDTVNAIASAFYNGGLLTARIAVDVGTRVFITPTSIEVQDGEAEEKYALLEHFQQAYANVQ